MDNNFYKNENLLLPIALNTNFNPTHKKKLFWCCRSKECRFRTKILNKYYPIFRSLNDE